MSIIYSFFDNQTIGVDELNKITSRLITDGVAREPSSVSDLNSFVADIAQAGVVPESDESLKVTAENGILKVNKGTAIFQNGSTIELTEPETMSYLTDRKQYVYLVSDMISNRAYIDVSDEEAEFENKVPLAIIQEGTVTDKRYYSRGKLAYYASADVNNNVYVEADHLENLAKDEDGYIVYSININADMYKYLQILDKNSFNFTRYNIKDDTFLSFGYGNSSHYTWNQDYMVVASNVNRQRCMCFIEKGESKITFKLKMETYPDRVIPISLRFEFIV